MLNPKNPLFTQGDYAEASDHRESQRSDPVTVYMWLQEASPFNNPSSIRPVKAE